MNDYVPELPPIQRFSLARPNEVDARIAAVAAGFDKLPPPRSLLEGRVTDAGGGGSANALTAALASPPDALTAGITATITPVATNTGPAMLNLNGLGPRRILNVDGSEVTAGQLIAGGSVQLRYDGEAFRILVGSFPVIGRTGPADNTYTTYAALLASDPTRKSARLVPQAGETEPAGNFSHINGAWVRQDAAGITVRADDPAAITRPAQAKFGETISVLDFGAIGDNAVHKVSEWIGAGKRYASLAALQADYPHVTSVDDYIDWAAIQATIDYLGANNGGTAVLPKIDGRYIINRGLKLKSSTCIRGAYPARFIYNAGNPKSSALVADFADPFQWVVDTDSRSNGQPLGLRSAYSAALPDEAVYDCGVHDLIITSIGNLPYGGVRIAGAPGSSTSGLGVHRVGIGVMVNMTFGGNFQALCLTAYYGFIGFNDYNGNNADVYAARDEAYSGDIPAPYQFWPFTDMAGQLAGSTYGLATNAHASRAIGILIGGSTSTSNNNTIAFVCERFDVGELLINTYSLSHTKAYVEASDMKAVFVAAQATFSHTNVHAYTSGTGVIFDLGKGVDADMRLNGSLFAGGFGSVVLDATARVVLRGVTLDQFGPTIPQYNLSYEAPGNWRPVTYQNGWGTAANAFPLRYRKEGRRVWLQGSVVGGSAGTLIGVIPPGWRSAMRADDFGKVLVAATGEITADAGGAISINLSWEAAQ